MNRRQLFEELAKPRTWDLAVIGGGATGACIARDAALRGLSVALTEKNDFAHATSAHNSKLVHGGLRYLRNFELGLVRESLKERRIWQRIAPHLEAQTLITDAGSTKSDVIEAARAALGARIAQFVPGHPIAGRESSGVEAALPDLYVGRNVILCPLAENAPEAVERIAAMWRACGWARSIFLTGITSKPRTILNRCR